MSGELKVYICWAFFQKKIYLPGTNFKSISCLYLVEAGKGIQHYTLHTKSI